MNSPVADAELELLHEAGVVHQVESREEIETFLLVRRKERLICMVFIKNLIIQIYVNDPVYV